MPTSARSAARRSADCHRLVRTRNVCRLNFTAVKLNIFTTGGFLRSSCRSLMMLSELVLDVFIQDRLKYGRRYFTVFCTPIRMPPMVVKAQC